MCGITGIYSFNTIGRMHLMHLEAATRLLARRGPDHHGTWFDDRAGLGHRRLSILDTSSLGRQPMHDENGRYTLVFNGEIYNFQSLAKSLRKAGHQFQSGSDTEVLLKAYITYGKEVVHQLNGFFAFAIYDRTNESMFIARDRFGIKPLYYLLDENKLLFASELGALLQYGIPKKIHKEALFTYLQLTYVPSPLCMIAEVQKLAPGHSISISPEGTDVACYYEFPHPSETAQASLTSLKDEVRHALNEAVNDRLVSDVPLGSYLSGGIDSSIIAGIASEQVQSLKTFSIGYRDHPYFDETCYAELVASHFKTDHHTFLLTNDDLLEGSKGLINSLSEPFADSSAIPAFVLAQKALQHVKVALSGDGADEIFSGYNKHEAWLKMATPGLANRVIKAGHPLWEVLPKSRNNPLTDTIRRLERYSQAIRLTPQERYWFLASFTQAGMAQSLLKGEYLPAHMSFKKHLLDQMKGTALNDMLALDCQLVLQGDMLQKVDFTSMANSLEVRVPFLDHRVVELAFRIQGSWKIHNGHRKYILKEAFRDFLPKELFNRGKHGFEVPLLDWFRGSLREELDRWVFNRDLVEEQGIFLWPPLQAIQRKLHSYDPGDLHSLVWSLYIFQRWYAKWKEW